MAADLKFDGDSVVSERSLSRRGGARRAVAAGHGELAGLSSGAKAGLLRRNPARMGENRGTRGLKKPGEPGRS
jgi:hypothetical protein